MYEIDENKIKIIDDLNIDNDVKKSYKELFLFPGVKETRANLYYLSGFKTLFDVSKSSVEEITLKMDECIKRFDLNYKIALQKK